MSKILIVDDEEAIANLIADSLQDEGIETVLKDNGQEALEIIKKEEFNLILLDIMMPKMDGYELCRKIRDIVTIPIIFLSAKNRTVDTLVGLELGADDYITKPFVVEELVARVKAHLRREQRKILDKPEEKASYLKLGDIEVKKDKFEVYKAGTLVGLSTREFELLSYLIENEGRVLTKEQIFDAVWGFDYGDIGTVAVNIKNIRDKIDKDGKYIKTIWGIGYKMIDGTI